MNDGSAIERVVRHLGALAADAVPGTRLPSVRELTAHHHVSPVTVAEATRRLVADGLIETRPGRGAYVSNRRADPPRPDLSWQTVALGSRRDGEEEMQALLALPPSGAIPLTGGYLD
ncbi:GntR family transcriptional regulator, partial [Micromonospora chalcea]